MRARVSILVFSLLCTTCGGTPVRRTDTPETEQPPELRGLFDRLDEPTVETDDPPRLVLRSGPAAPEPGRAEIPFPPPAPPVSGPPPTGPAEPLRVLSYAPRGEDTLVGAVRVTFSQPMVPVAALSALAARDVPVQIEPRVAGRFRWLGTTTVAFEPDPSIGSRMPLATEFTVRVPAGTQSAIGGRLEQETRFTFSTPPLRVLAMWPERQQSVDVEPLIALRFNQRVDPAAIAAATSIAGDGDPRLVLLDARQTEVARNDTPALQGWEDDRVAFFRVASPLRKGTMYTVRVAAGTRGSEGPRPLPSAWSGSFHTYGALRVVRVDCGYHEICRPDSTVTVELSNSLALPQELEPLIAIQPAVGELEVQPSGGMIHLRAEWRARTRYRITVRAAVRDRFGQTLGADSTHEVAIGDAYPYVIPHNETFPTIEMGSARAFPVDVMNTARIRARTAPVPVAKLGPAVHAARHGWGPWDDRPDPFREHGLAVRAHDLPTRTPRNVADRVGVPLESAIPSDRSGFALVEIQVPSGGREVYREYRLVQATDLGVTAALDAFGGTVRVTSLSTGEPVAGASVRVAPVDTPQQNETVTTGADGIARFERGTTTTEHLVLVSKDGDQAFALVGGSRIPDDLIGTIFTDRDPYRPGDTVHLRVAVRKRAETAAAETESLAGQAFNCEVNSPSAQVGTFQGNFSAYGTHSHDLELPVDAATGSWRVECHVAAHGFVVKYFHVEEYRAPEIEVEVRAPDGPHFAGGQTTATVEARYLFGAAAAKLPARWTIGRERTTFRPEGHEGFVFGDGASARWRPWITPQRQRRHGRGRVVHVRDDSQRDVYATGNGTTDDEGRVRIPTKLEVPETQRGEAFKFVVEAEVTDESQQQVAGRTEITAHPASFYVGLRTGQRFLTANDAIQARAIVVDTTGRAVAGRSFVLKALARRSRLVASEHDGRWTFTWQNEDREVGRCELRSADEPVDCRIGAQRPGTYVLEATIEDAERRSQTTRVPLFVAGPGWVPWNAEEQQLELVPDKNEYRAGETARILVRAPFSRGRGLLVVERQGAVDTRPIDFEGSIGIVEVPVREGWVPGVGVRVMLARGRASDRELAQMLEQAGPDAQRAAREDVGRPQYGAAEIQLAVADAPKRLDVEVRPEHEVRAPGQPLQVDVRVTAGGRAADAEVTVMVVDEAVLRLLGHETPDPVPSLHPQPPATLSVGAVHPRILRRRPMRELIPRVQAHQPDVRGGGAVRRRAGGDEPLAGLDGLGDGGGSTGTHATVARPMRMAANGGGGGGRETVVRTIRGNASMALEGDTAGAIPDSARSIFATTAFYRAAAVTNAEGRVRVRFDLPDNLTTFRIMAVAIGRDDRSGKGEARVRVRKTVLLRPALPRFATLGDTFDAAVVVHNETGEAAEILVGMRAAGMTATGDTYRRVRLRQGEARAVSFPVRVDVAGGTAKVQFAASATDGADAVEATLPLVQPATSEAFATYGSLTEDAMRIPVEVPEDVIERWGGLELRLSSTALTSLDEAAEYLWEYPYACAEQYSSRLIAAAAIQQVMHDRDAEMEARAIANGRAAIPALLRLQRWDGGFVYWPRMSETELYVSAWVTFALLEAQRAGQTVPQQSVDRALQFLEQRLQRPRAHFGEDRAWAVQALALYVLAQGGRVPDANIVNRVHSHREELPIFAKAWLISALERRNAQDARAAELWREIENAAVETPAGAHFSEQRVESARLLWHSERRTDAIVLGMMLENRGSHPLVEKTVRGLIAARRNGVWHTTQENAWALSAVTRYYRAAEAVVPDFTAQAWLGESFVGEVEMRGRSGAILEGMVPMADLRRMGSGDFVLARRGQGRLYYRIGMRYAPSDFRLPPEEQGFAVSRLYEAIEDPEDVRRDEDGVWRIKLGKEVRVRVTVVVPDDRYDVAVDDPLPAGLEAVNMAFRTTATQRLSRAQNEQRYDFGHYWALFAFDHRELRDDRVVAFARFAPAGVYEITYIARSTTSGRFVATPTRAEEMYAPEVFGRAAGDVVIVEAGR